MTIVVTTPTGNVGSRTVQLLLQAGVRPRLLVRDPGRLDAATRARAEVRVGDLTDTAFVREATRGADSVLWVDPTPATVAAPVETSLRTADGLVEAARAGEVARVVLLSSVGAELRHGAGHIDALGGIEERLDATGADVLHLRCGYFFSNLWTELDGLARGVLTTAFDPDRPMAWVDPRDIGEVAAARLLSSAWRGRVVQGVHGPEDLSPADVARILSEVLGRPIRLDALSDADVRAGLRGAGLPPGAVEAIAGMSAGTRHLTPDPPRGPLTTTPGTLTAWASTRLRPALASHGGAEARGTGAEDSAPRREGTAPPPADRS
ncbi:NmrA family transcriptional regulator [Streptomyces sp. AJS327]|uniref:NmrA family NAD(P)-binding protein n=1 Tax=Streptomyces sp. AJS327 TaxID=2545265 RepID=UPI0015E01B70|nr:NAD(P)H-binding protein [Streptomyces sp. AJS327]MBA0052775.1 NmrA family transcriptional regulator [Streptomyces sp. AJS327]